jgi:hypothetical protein
VQAAPAVYPSRRLRASSIPVSDVMLDLNSLSKLERSCFIAVLRYLVDNDYSDLSVAQINHVTFPGVNKPFMKMALSSLVEKKFLIVNQDEDDHDSSWELHPSIAPDAYEFVEADYQVPEIAPVSDVPAADRFVAIDHNSAAYKEADETLEQLTSAVKGVNDLFANAEERLAVVSRSYSRHACDSLADVA